MATMRRRRQFKAEVLTVRGQQLSECFAIIDIETTTSEGVRERRWRGKFSSLSNPEHAFAGSYLLRARGTEEEAKIDVMEGAAERLGVTSDEYAFIGLGTPPNPPRTRGLRRQRDREQR